MPLSLGVLNIQSALQSKHLCKFVVWHVCVCRGACMGCIDRVQILIQIGNEITFGRQHPVIHSRCFTVMSAWDAHRYHRYAIPILCKFIA